MSSVWSNKLPEIPGHPNNDERVAINALMRGNSDNHGEADLATATAVTTISTINSCETSCVMIVPMNAQARTEYLAGTAYISAVRCGEFDIAHPAGSAQRTFRFSWIG